MPSLGDSAFIFMLALMLLGPKKLPQLARQLGKLMAEFRKASNDFRMQMEDELRIEDQKEHQRKVDALAPPPSAVPNPDIPTEDPPHPHLPAPASHADEVNLTDAEITPLHAAGEVTPIAESGELKMMPPSTGLPVESTSRRSTFASSRDGLSGSERNGESATGMSSEEPGEASLDAATYEPPPDRSHPVMVGEGERATHA